MAAGASTDRRLRAEAALLLGTPAAMKVHLLVTTLAALTLPWVLPTLLGLDGVDSTQPDWVTVLVLVAMSVLNVEIGRVMAGGVSTTDQPHKALSAWAFATALLLPPPYLLLVVPLTYAHARWRGLRITRWKWAGSGAYLVLAGLAAAVVVDLTLPDGQLFAGDGGRGVLAVLASAATFLLVATLLLWGSVTFNHAWDEVWLRATLTSGGYYSTESSVILVGGLLATIWAEAPWFVLMVLPVYVLVQRAALLEPVRERAEAAAALAEKNQELEEANAFKVDLLGMLGHEIGNPLTSVVGYAEVATEAADDGDSATTGHALQVISRSAGEIQDVLAEILAMVASDRGALSAVPEDCLLLPHLEGAVSVTDARGATPPAIECDPDLRVRVQPVHLDQVLRNLLSNAGKYAGGAVRLRAVSVGAGPDAVVEVHVEDAGPGVPEDVRELLFTRFGRAEQHRAVRGTGLGLFITRELVRANGGEVEHRPLSPGSDFVVTLPAVP